jgi:hypothetical protein
VERSDHDEISGVLRGLVIRLDDRLAAEDSALITEFIEVGEFGLALEQIADVLSEDEQPLSDSERSDLLALVARMAMGNRAPHALTFCPTR